LLHWNAHLDVSARVGIGDTVVDRERESRWVGADVGEVAQHPAEPGGEVVEDLRIAGPGAVGDGGDHGGGLDGDLLRHVRWRGVVLSVDALPELGGQPVDLVSATLHRRQVRFEPRLRIVTVEHLGDIRQRHVGDSQEPDRLGPCELLQPVVAVAGVGVDEGCR
jgi:hypothetical protein